MSGGALVGKTALVTGGCVRIGRSISEALAQAGATVIMQHRAATAAAAAAVAATLTADGLAVHAVAQDFHVIADADHLMDTLQRRDMVPDILVNNAAIFPADSCQTATAQTLLTAITVNAFIPFRLSQLFYSLSRPGVIVNILDTRVSALDPGHVSYQGSKELLRYFTEMTALTFAPRVRVNAVAPGLIVPPLGAGPEYVSQRRWRNALQRGGNPADVAAAVLFLCVQEFITGQVLFIDAGEQIKNKTYAEIRTDHAG